MYRFEPFPELKTEHLLLRKMSEQDIFDLFQMRKDPRMILYTDSKLDGSPEETKQYVEKMNRGIVEGQWLVWAIEYQPDQKVIGTISIWNIQEEERKAELGYGIIPEYQNRGFMKEALLRVCDYGFRTMDLQALEAYTEEENVPSLQLLEKSGFSLVDKVEDEGYYSDRVYQMLVYRLTDQS